MEHMNRERIEQKAVNAIRDTFDNVPGILSAINERDKNPCIDGVLRVYESEDSRKDNLVGEIDVQVKGTASKVKSNNHTKLKVDATDLKKYKKVYKGVIYFVVHVGFNDKPKIFYKTYLPYELDEALGRLKQDNQQTLLERFKPLPSDQSFLRRLCDEFLADRDKQLTDSIVGFKSLEEWQEQEVVFDKFVLSKRLFSPDELIQLDTWSNGGYWYGITKDGVYHLIDKVDEIERVEMGIPHILHAGEYSDEYMLMSGQDADGEFVSFGGFTARLNCNPRFNFKFEGDFRARLKDARLAREMAANGTLWVEDIPLFQGIKFNDTSLDEMDKRIESLEKIVSLLELLAVKVELLPDEMTEFEFGQLGRLGASLIDGEEVPLNVPDDDLINLNMEFGKGRIKIIAIRSNDNKYRLCDPLEKGYVCVLSDHPDEVPEDVSPLPTFFLLNREDFNRAMNLDAQKLMEALDETPIVATNANATCYKLLDMIHAYDDGAVCSNELLECCLLVAEKLYEIEESSEAYRINYAQVLKRMDKMSPETEDDLREIALHSQRNEAKASAYILLNDFVMAEKCIEDIPERAREEFERWPILNLKSKSSPTKKITDSKNKRRIKIMQRISTSSDISKDALTQTPPT